ncbi:SDR family oxidoreductase [Aquabacterium sp. A7-Y]|uniref:SDR family NAD(P)-dependent oxidoreductase n=1 Tax=Aquabacterium sp. A7-Y TaxID=1349605 RepID=UPI00223D200E|nr:SDR family oxidoreductase [Aquabacterium sp. A7-Y]MCW7537918.1 SDR family oxidoreductase [Aquabacterium sp. A7-Y]
MKSFQNKVAAITGAASGMGRELAIELAARGCHLALCDLNETGLQETVRLAARPGVHMTAARLDVGDRAAVYAWADSVAAEHGRVNLIFNNAGVAVASQLEQVDREDFEWIMGINFWGVVWGTQAFLPHLRASGEGHVVNTSSVFGLVAVPGQGPYNASKFAVRAYTEALRMELALAGAPVSATCVHPGGIRTHIARDSRIAPNVQQLTGLPPEESRQRFDRLLNTTSARSAALQILKAVQRNRRRVLIGPDAKLLDLLVRVLASGYQPLLEGALRRLRDARGKHGTLPAAD